LIVFWQLEEKEKCLKNLYFAPAVVAAGETV
jgi:hypothetical protein